MPAAPILHLSFAADAADGGVATAVAALAAAQRRQGLSVEWLTADRWPGWRRDAGLWQATRRAGPALAHLHGLWQSPGRIGALLAADGLPLVVAPHGMLDPWALAQSRWKKRLMRRLLVDATLRSAACLQALCAAEAEAITAQGLAVPVALIPNGVELPPPDGGPPGGAALPPPPWAHAVPEGEPVLLFLGRFHEKKGTAPLLDAWQALQAEARRAGWWLALVGYGDNGALAAQVHARQLRRCLVLGPCFGAQKQACLAAASAFVLPSFSEGLPMAALEAMAWGLPALLSEPCNLPEAFAAGAALPAPPEPGALAANCRQLFALSPAERAAIGGRGRALMAERFSWASVAERTARLYGWILGGGERPDFVEDGGR